MILAAGQGKRMGVLTEKTPKPLLQLAGKHLIDYSINALVKVGITDIAINICHHREQIKNTLGCGKRYGAKFFYSEEEEPLETGGGIRQILPYFGDQPFLVLSCDIVTEFPFKNLPKKLDKLAHIVLVNNPDFHPQGDFLLQDRIVSLGQGNTFTFSNIGLYHPELFADYQPGKFRLGDVLKQAAMRGEVSGEHYVGVWHNIGTAEQLQQAEQVFSSYSF